MPERFTLTLESDDPHAGRYVAWLAKLALRRFGLRAVATPADPTRADVTAFAGWLRVEGGRWELVCTGCRADVCWQLLFDHGPPQAPRVERVVLPRGRTPEG